MQTCYDPTKRRWDRFEAFHHLVDNNHNITQFDTGEVIFLGAKAHVDSRKHYQKLNVRLDTTSHLDQSLYDTHGREIKRAFFPQTQHILIDYDSGRVVSTEGKVYAPVGQEVPTRHGVPKRFQKVAQVYIGGEGQFPVPVETIIAQVPHKHVADDAQLEHLTMLRTTFMAAAKLTDLKVGELWQAKTAMPFAIALQCKDWQDVPAAQYGQMFYHGVARPIVKYPYLLLEPPK